MHGPSTQAASVKDTLSHSRSGSAAQKVETWLALLLFVKPGKANAVLLSTYFFVVFSRDLHDLNSFLHALRQRLQKKHPNKALAEKYLHIISPIFEKFGLYEEKSQMDDLCFSVLHPKDFARIQKLLRDYKRSSSSFIAAVKRKLSLLMKSKGIPCEVSGRFKHAYSIWLKMKKKQLEALDSVPKLYDIFAFRIIVDSEEIRQCFDCMNALHDEYTPLAKRFKDYINIPKLNGYQSIHTCLTHVVDDLELPVEVQIRTRTMNEFAEKGLASHWMYELSQKRHAVTSEERRLAAHFLNLSRSPVDGSNIYCASIGGDMYSLPLNATYRDFAYAVHTKLGEEATYAVVNGKQRELDDTIAEGDCVEIVRNSKRTSSPRKKKTSLPRTS